jgi:hypothetical protein
MRYPALIFLQTDQHLFLLYQLYPIKKYNWSTIPDYIAIKQG